MAGKKTMKLASNGKRFGAGCIDIGIMAVLYIFLMISIAASSARRYRTYGYGYGFEDGYGFGYDYGYQQPTNTGAIVAAVIIGFLMLAYLIVEFIFYAQSKSIGKAILGLQVVSSNDGRPLGFWKMLFREAIVKQASGVLMLGYIWILIDDRNRAWHDKILETYVVDLKESEKLNVLKKETAAAPAAPSPVPVSVAQPAPAEEPVHAVPSTPSADETAATDETAAVVQTAAVAQKAAVDETAAAAQTAAAASQEAVPTADVEVEPAKPETEAKPKASAIPKAPVIRLDIDHEPEETPVTKATTDAVQESEEMPAPETEITTDADHEPEEAPVPETKTDAIQEPVPAAEIRVDMSMKKAELLEVAEKLGINVGSRATKAEIIEAIRKAAE